ncbi:MAG TPA: hypothetical protein V6D15_07640 [Oculatellaceae cyanobacterium]|jgi:hypothetical protein
MNLSLLDRIGDWNPQLFREIKGRLRPRNLTIAVAISLVGQLLLMMALVSELPFEIAVDKLLNRYCTGNRDPYSGNRGCLFGAVGSVVIDWQLWSLNAFIWLSIIGIFVLLVAGSYVLISDLSREEQRGTLNFIRLSPQSTQTILTGKLLGVPILLYVVAGLAVPLHLCLGLVANIPLSLIFSFYCIFVASCLFFYSVSLLIALVSHKLGAFQAFLGSGSLLMFLWKTINIRQYSYNVFDNSADWLMLFNPSFFLPYLTASSSIPSDLLRGFKLNDLNLLDWFYLPVGGSAWSATSFMLLNYGLSTYLVWQALKRCFHNPSSTILSKRQSYQLTAFFTVMIVGFSWQRPESNSHLETFFLNFGFLGVFNLLLFLGLIAALSPQRQAVQDWARYRHQNSSSRKGILQDLIWGEKSPAIVAIGINLAISAVMLISWALFSAASDYKRASLLSVVLSINVILIYAGITQIMLLMKTPKQGIWAASTVSGLIILPPIILQVLSIEPDKQPLLWLFSAFSWAAVKEASTTAVLMAVLSQWLGLTLLGLQLRRQLQKAGESHTKYLLGGCTLPTG